MERPSPHPQEGRKHGRPKQHRHAAPRLSPTATQPSYCRLTQVGLAWLEPYARKPARTVLREVGCSNAARLPDDTPVHDALRYGYFDNLRHLLAGMMHKTFKGNDALHKAMVTGILKVGQASFFSELNNVGVHTMLHPSRYAPYFGFTEQETFDRPLPPHLRSHLQRLSFVFSSRL